MDRELTISRNLCPGTILQSTKVLPKSFRKFHTSINFRVVTKLDIPPLRLTSGAKNYFCEFFCLDFRVVTKLDIPPLRLTTEKSERAKYYFCEFFCLDFRVVTKLEIPPLRLTTEKSEGAADGTADGTKVPVSHYLKLVYF